MTNFKVISRTIGPILLLEVLMMVPALCICLYDGDGSMALSFLATMGITALVGGAMSWYSRKEQSSLMAHEGFTIVALCWIFMSLLGALPFWFSGAIPSYIDALFETVSGFTTTGASILPEVESLSRGLLYWRSFTHWVGGMGVLVFLLAIVPMNGGSHMNLMKAESPGPSVGKLVPKVKSTAQILYLIYFAMTVVQIILLLLGGMNLFEAICTAFGTAGTGGFGVRGDSIAGYSPYIQWVVTVFMLLFGVNFNAYYYIVFGKVRKALAMEEVRWYFIIVLVASVFITINIMPLYNDMFETVTHAFFQVGTIITTTGFATTDFNLWPAASKTILVLLMFLGACAGSTGGGFKVSRVLILSKTLGKEIHSYLHPKSVRKVKFEGSPVEHEVLRSINVYLVTYIILFIASVFLVSLENYDLISTFTAVAATFNNIGPGLELVGPVANFAFFNDFTKWVLIFDMLAGRLELFPMLMLFHPTLWRDMYVRYRAGKGKK